MFYRQFLRVAPRFIGLMLLVASLFPLRGAYARSVASGSSVVAVGETTPMPHTGDAADDPAIWVHPTDTTQSTIIGTDKQGGIAVYSLSGSQIQYRADGNMNNVDLRYNFLLAGQHVALVTATNRSNGSIAIYRVNPASRLLEPVVGTRIYPATSGYGLCMYHSPTSGKYFVFVTAYGGNVEQWELFDNGSGKVNGTRVRSFNVGSTAEGCVADDENGALYLSQESVGIWRYGAEPGTGTTRTKVDGTGTAGHLVADVEGLTIYYTSTGSGYLLASSQGNSTFATYARASGNAYVGSFTIAASTSIDAVTKTDGIDVTNVALNGTFSQGLLVVHDDINNGANQNFKLVPWGNVAQAFAPNLSIDTTWDPRQVGASQLPNTTPTPTITSAPTNTPTASPTSTATATPTPTEQPAATTTPTALPTNAPTSTSLPTVPPTATTPTATPPPTVPGVTTQTFIAEADARVEQANPNTNYGTATTLRVDGGSDPDVDSFLRFSVQNLAGSITSVKVRVYLTTASSDGPAIYRSATAWNESSITWNTRPSRTSGELGNKGSVTANTWIEYNVTTTVIGNGTYSFALATAGTDGVTIASREGTNRPQLVVVTNS